MSKVFINPNFHALLVHFPIGVFLLGLLVELGSFMYRGSPLRSAGRWMILLGALAAIPAAYTGIYALQDVANRSQADGRTPTNEPWKVVAADARLRGPGGAIVRTPTGHSRGAQLRAAETAEIWTMFRHHVWREASGTLLAALTVVVALGCSDLRRRQIYPAFLVLLIVSAGLMSWGAWSAGEAVYRFGAATRLEKSSPTAPTSDAPAKMARSPASERRTSAGPSSLAPLVRVPSLLAAMPLELAPAAPLGPTTRPDAAPAPSTAPTAHAEPTSERAEPTSERTEPNSDRPAPASTRAEPTSERVVEPVSRTQPATESALATEPATRADHPVEPAPPLTEPAGRTTEPAPPPRPTTLTTLPVAPLVPPGIITLVPPAPRRAPSTAPAATQPAPARETRERAEPAEEEVKPGALAYHIGPPVQLHVLLAGLVSAAALLALGFSMRRLSVLKAQTALVSAADLDDLDAPDAIIAGSDAPGRRPVSGRDLDVARSLNPSANVIGLFVPLERPPAARLWIAAFLIALLTAGVGVYCLAAPHNFGGDELGWTSRILWSAICDKEQNHAGLLTRRLAHLIVGASIVLLTLLSAIFARWTRSRLLLAVVALLLTAALAAQVWLGVLLMYDTNLGKITQFSTASPPQMGHGE